jgi:hypothetical protein
MFFQIQQLLKTSRPGVSLPKVVLYKFDKKKSFSHLAKVQEVTALNVLKETNNLLDFLKL